MSQTITIDNLQKALGSGRSLTVAETNAMLSLINAFRASSAGLSKAELNHVKQSIKEIERLHEMVFMSQPALDGGIQKGLQLQMSFLKSAVKVTERAG